jgi:hypothetical protein
MVHVYGTFTCIAIPLVRTRVPAESTKWYVLEYHVRKTQIYMEGGVCVTSNKSGIQMLQMTPQIHQSPISSLIEVLINYHSTLYYYTPQNVPLVGPHKSTKVLFIT